VQANDFTGDAHGGLIRNLSGQLTFIPKPLPGPLRLDWELNNLLNTAERAVGRLVGVGQTLPDPGIVVQSFIRREAQLSSRIENTYAEISDLALFEQTPQSVEKRVPDVREVHNNERALSYGIAALQRGRELGLPLIKDIHDLLLRGVRGNERRPGQFRNIQMFIGRSDRIEEARFVPAPPEQVPGLMEHLEAYIKAPGDLPPIARAAMAHYQFEAIHPFEDGNGRIGRVLILLLLRAEGVLPLPLLNPSTFLEAHRDEYYRHLLDVSQKGTWTEWVKFFARGIEASAADAIDRIERIKRLQAEYHAKFQTARSSALLLKLVDELFIRQAITPTRAADVLNVTYLAACRSIDKLVAAGILREVTGQQRNRLYLADGIIKAVQGIDEPPAKPPRGRETTRS
jgi:Fic family protein